MKLDGQDHRSLALWAADCAGRVLPYFEGEHPGDDRPRRAIEAGQAWARGEIKVGEARAAAIAAHAAREVDGAAAPAAARATGHAAASPNGQIVLPSILLWTSHNRSISLILPLPYSMLYKIFSIQPVPSRQGEHWPQLSWR